MSTMESEHAESPDTLQTDTMLRLPVDTHSTEKQMAIFDDSTEVVAQETNSSSSDAISDIPIVFEEKEEGGCTNRRKALILGLILLIVGCVTAVILFTTGEEGSISRSQAMRVPPTQLPTIVPSDSPITVPSAQPTADPSVQPSSKPSFSPSDMPSDLPTKKPSASPTDTPSVSPTENPTRSPTASPSLHPTDYPTLFPTEPPTKYPTPAPSVSINPTTTPMPTGLATFVPGNLTVEEEGLLLSQGLRARIIGVSGQNVSYHDGSSSEILFHSLPDFGATFRDTRPFNRGGWVYASNSEVKEQGEGGVGSITFDKDGNVIDYRMVLEGTTMNCGGGRTPWNTWVSCEEVEFFGEIYQVDPFGERPAEKATIGSELGRWESFAFDVRDSADPRFFATEDHNKGTVRRFRPESKKIDWDSPWDMLHEDGIIDYLFVNPDIRENETTAGGTFEWTNDIEAARFNAREFYPQTEGIDIYNGTMYVVCKRIKQMFVFDLDTMTYYNQSTVTGLFDGGPDQMQRILDDDPGDLLFFTEEGGKDAGIHARDNLGRFYTVFESPVYQDETTGLAFSPDGKHMYVAYQVNGLLFDIWREDGLSFGARTLNVKYHHVD